MGGEGETERESEGVWRGWGGVIGLMCHKLGELLTLPCTINVMVPDTFFVPPSFHLSLSLSPSLPPSLFSLFLFASLHRESLQAKGLWISGKALTLGSEDKTRRGNER